MSLKHREIAAWGLIVLSAISFFLGQLFKQNQGLHHPYSTEFVEETSVSGPTGEQEETVIPDGEAEENGKASSVFLVDEQTALICFWVFSFVSAGAGIGAVFVFSAKAPLLGSDLALILLGLQTLGTVPESRIVHAIFGAARLLLALMCLRELWGWLMAHCPLNWLLPVRITKRMENPQSVLTVMGGCVCVVSMGTAAAFFGGRWGAALLFLTAAVLAAACLWYSGKELQHFRHQLERFAQGQPMEVGSGLMGTAEARLWEIRQQHEQAVKAAVASEHFKVELISNVSHDLRTPLTAILGYGELLEQETLSPEGRVRLARLNQKAGYMRELVDALFELTKVSSGVVECRREPIDLICLLEQTIGLTDDQLALAGLTVKRHYFSPSVPVVTDGGRMHQVFANLLGNAIKYALSGSRIHLEVKDTGDSYTVRMVNTASYEMDFSPEEIVQRFARGDKARSTGGSGLGLAIAQTYTESVGGRFFVRIDADQFSAVVVLPKTERNP